MLNIKQIIGFCNAEKILAGTSKLWKITMVRFVDVALRAASILKNHILFVCVYVPEVSKLLY